MGYEFPTKGSSLSGILAALFNLVNFSLLFFKFLSLDSTLSLLDYLFLLKITNPFSLLTSTIYTVRLVECSWLCSGLTRVGGIQFDYFWQGICFIGNSGNGVGTGSILQ